MPGTIPGTADVAVNKITIPAFMKCTFGEVADNM